MLRAKQNEILNRVEMATLAQYGAYVGHIHSDGWTRIQGAPECFVRNVQNDLMIRLLSVMSYLRSKVERLQTPANIGNCSNSSEFGAAIFHRLPPFCRREAFTELQEQTRQTACAGRCR